MKRFAALFLLLCMALSAIPAFAAESLGSMEVIRCKEWVSLREKPDTAAKRLAKVPLGAVVSRCEQAGDGWIYAEYDGHAGYIQARYLTPSDNRLTFNAMLITIAGEGAPFYATLDAETPSDVVPTDTLVRNCRVMDNGWVYVEWGGRCGFISLLHADVYNELIHVPGRITLHSVPGSCASGGAPPALNIAYGDAFPGRQYDSGGLAAGEYGEEETADLPKVHFILYSDEPLDAVHLFSLTVRSCEEATGEVIYDAALETVQHRVDPEHPLSVSAVIWGDTPNLAVGYARENGAYHFAFVEISGEDGRLILREF